MTATDSHRVRINSMKISAIRHVATLLAFFLTGLASAHASVLAPDRASVYLSPELQATANTETPANLEFRKGVQALLGNRLAEAEPAFLKARQLDPHFAAPLLGLADIALKKKQPDLVVKWLTAADQASPNSSQVKLAWGRYYRSQNKPDKAEAMLKQSISLNPSATAYVELSHLYVADLNKPDAAVLASEKAVALAPDNPVIHYALATSLAAAGRVDEAVRAFEQVTRLKPSDPAPWRAIGRLHAEKHRFNEAAKALDQAMQLQPGDAAIVADRGDVAVALNKPDDAIRFYELATRQQPSSAILFSKLGLVYQVSKQASAAETAYLKALKLDPKLADVYNNLAWLMAGDSARSADALKWAEKANLIAPNTPTYLDTLGWFQHLRGDDAKAIASLQKAIQLKPDLAEAHHHQGLIYAKQGKKTEAMVAFKRALAINPNFTYSAEARKKLAELK